MSLTCDTHGCLILEHRAVHAFRGLNMYVFTHLMERRQALKRCQKILQSNVMRMVCSDARNLPQPVKARQHTGSHKFHTNQVQSSKKLMLRSSRSKRFDDFAYVLPLTKRRA
jgi:hypothetical protein